MVERPLHIAVLEVLARRVNDRREQLKEQMASGLPPEDYPAAVGRARECKALLEQIEEMLKAAQQGEIEEDDDADIEDRRSGRRPAARKSHR